MANSTVYDHIALLNNFTYHRPVENQIERMKEIRKMARALAGRLIESCPPSRERALALTNLEQSVMWANASIVRNEKESIDEELDEA